MKPIGKGVSFLSKCVTGDGFWNFKCSNQACYHYFLLLPVYADLELSDPSSSPYVPVHNVFCHDDNGINIGT